MFRPGSTLALVLLVILAGCAGSAPLANEEVDDGTVSVYLSDEQNAIDDFDHLNVTVTNVGLQRADGNWSSRHRGDHDHEHRGRWVVADVDNRTVDLTRLQGPNATLLDTIAVRNGTYRRAFVQVRDVNATLRNGTSVDVDLPRDRLMVTHEFRVDDGQVVDFVVDVTVVNRDGEYVIVSRAGHSGDGVPICRMDGQCECDGHGGQHGTHRNHTHGGHTHEGHTHAGHTHENRTHGSGQNGGCHCDGC